MEKPNGIILVTGPTGSGKTTTLYSALNEANDISRKIITTEDPVEYDLDGILQIPINEEIGVTYAACLRSILRHDPDVILVGEIRDRDTAQIAIEASLTGHLVLSTLHTNDAPSAITRIVDIGVEPFLLAATLEGIVAQRLIRTICPSCRSFYEPTEDVLMEVDLKPEDVAGKKFALGKGCDECHGSGYRGRRGIFEILEVNDAIRDEILREGSAEAVRRLAREAGMQTLRDEGLLAVFDGLTSVEEIVRETIGIE
jgi:type IV pilus assembly protein PilB